MKVAFPDPLGPLSKIVLGNLPLSKSILNELKYVLRTT